jgi:peptide/nickel transport system substrate-binding protein
MRRQISTIAMIALCVLLFSTTSIFAGPKDVVKVGLQYDPTTMNMLQMKTGGDLSPILHIHQSLQGTDPYTGERNFENSLTESAEILENGKDIKFKMVRGYSFHTGDPVTAHDVKFTYEQCANPSNANLMAAPLDEIEEIEIIDDYTFIFRFWEPYAAWRELLWIGICSKKYYEKVGPEQFAKHPVGSAPLKFEERRIGEYITLKADPNFKWTENVPYTDPDTGEQKTKIVERKVDFGTLKFIIVPDDVTRMAMLETGELDLISDIPPHFLKRLKKNKKLVIRRASTAPSLFALSSKPDNYPIFKDPKFALSFSYAINRQEIVDKIYQGEGYPMYTFASRSELGYDPDVVYEFNPDTARQLIQESSYKPGTPIILTYTSVLLNADLVAATIQKYMKNVGVTIKLQKLEAGTQATYARNRDPKEGHLTLYAWAGGRDPSTRLLLTMPANSIYNSWTTRKTQKQIEKLTFAQAHEMDPEKRLAFLNELHGLLSDEPGGAILFGLNQIYAHQDRIDYSWLPMEAFLFNLQRITIVK